MQAKKACKTRSVLTARNIAMHLCSEVVVHEEAHVEEDLITFPDAAGKGVQGASELLQAVPSHRSRRVPPYMGVSENSGYLILESL